MTELEITPTVENDVVTVSLSRPPVNAVRYEDVRSLTEFFDSLSTEDGLACVITTGGEKTFMAGHDVDEFVDYEPANADSYTETYMSFIDTVYTLPIPTIVAVDGPAVGAGAIFASLCDLRVASPDATFALPEINVGIVGGFGPIRRLLPDSVARRMLYTGEEITADRAYELGMVSELADDPHRAATELGETIASKSPDAVRAARRVTIESQPRWPIEEYRREREAIDRLRRGTNAEEAAEAFLENRDPDFQR